MDMYNRKLYLKFFLKKLLLRVILKSLNINNSRRYLALVYMSRLPKKSSLTYINNRCINSGRVWSVNKKTGLSRFELRNQVYKSNIPGFRRASW